MQAIERFTPAEDDAGIVFIKLAEGRGWVPIRDGDAHSSSPHGSARFV